MSTENIYFALGVTSAIQEKQQQEQEAIERRVGRGT